MTSPPVLATSQRRCRSCIHPAHLGTCTARSGGTAYACGCPVVTLADDPEYGRPSPAAVEPPEPCLDCEIVPDALGCECDRAGTLEDRLARAIARRTADHHTAAEVPPWPSR